MKKRSNRFFSSFESYLGLLERGEKLWFRWGLFLLILYLEFVFFCQNLFLGSTSPFFLVFCAIAAVPLCVWGVWLCRKLQLSLEYRQVIRRNTLLVTAVAFAVTFLFMLAAQYGFWPGSYANDNFTQLKQVASQSYNNWHPVLHTWLFFTLPLKIIPQPWFPITLQLVWYSMAVGYFIRVLYVTGCPKWLLIFSWCYVVLNPNTIDLMLYPLKDSALTLFALILYTQLIQIYLSQGAWLKPLRNQLALGLIGFLCLGMRHNAVLLVAPVFLFLLIFFKAFRRQVVTVCATALALTLLWQGAVIPLANVGKPDQRTIETMGLPMTVLCDIYVYDNDALSEDARQFLDSIATEEEWETYESGSFNSIKWVNDTLITDVDGQGAGNLLRYALEGSLSSPKTALKAFVNLTHLVWGIENSGGYLIGEQVVSNAMGIQAQYHDSCKFFFTSWRQVCSVGMLRYVFGFIGPIILLLLFLAVSQLGGGNLASVFQVLAPMAYNFGTMLLLSGQDYRFFHMNYVIVIPLVYIILTNKRTSHVQ